METEYILEAKGIRKEFSGVIALNNVELKVRKATVHALMGENGAGKSTLMKILIGIYERDAGDIIFKGKSIHLKSIQQSIEIGIAMIHQELNPIPRMTVAENIFLGREAGYFIVNKEKMFNDTQALFDKLSIELNPRDYMYQLTVAQCQLAEIAKAISYNADLIIMDEPTSSITEKEVVHLFEIIRRLKSEGISIIYISHKMDEIFKISDDISIYRDGNYIFTDRAENLSRDKLISLMVGREIDQMFPKLTADIGETRLEVINLNCNDLLHNVSFDLKRGEILGFAGLIGAGRTEVMECIFGIRKYQSGKIKIDGKDAKINNPIDAIRYKIAFLTEDRRQTGIFGPLSIAENMIITSIDDYISGFILNKTQIKNTCSQQVRQFSIKTPNLAQKIQNLSGGNQQKVLIARWLLSAPDILIIDEPTRGIDVGSKAEIHLVISKLAQSGKSVILISSELPEIIGMSDRVVVMNNGEITQILPRNKLSQEKIMHHATNIVA